jgi:SAM-dependent methyltransferase
MSDQDQGRDNKAHWNDQSRRWTATAPKGKAADDTFNQMIIAEAGIRPGEAVLDIASGTGNPAVSIALSMDGKGSVTCTDLMPRMLEAARVRAENLSLSIMRFVGADMLSLPFAEGVFDCATCRFGLMFPGDRVAAAREVLRVLKPGGRVAYMVWGPYEENPPFVVPRRTVAKFLGADEGPVPPRHVLGAAGAIGDVLRGAGFDRVEERELRYLNRIEDAADYVSRGLKRSFAKQVEGLAEDRFAALCDAVLDAWAPYFQDGVLQVPNCARLGLGFRTG